MSRGARGAAGTDPDGGVDALFREKRREDRIRAQGYVVVRVTWADLFHPERIVAAVQSALMAAVA